MLFASLLPPLDLFTVKAVTLLTVLVVSVSMLLAWKSNRPVAGMRHLTLGLLSICGGAVVGMSRLLIPGNIIYIVGVVLMVGGLATVARGIRDFRGISPVRTVYVAAATVVFMGFYLYWLFIHDDFGRRVGVVSCAMAILAADGAFSMMRRVSARNRMVYWPTAVALGFTSMFLCIRTIAAFKGLYGSNFLAPVPIEIPLSLCADVAYIATAFGMLLASNNQMRRTAERMAHYDPLTNLPNRRVFDDRLLAAEARAAEQKWLLGIIYLDLDSFKLVNDTLGHGAGDKLLRNVSLAMASVLRAGDCLARVGGDEFVVLVEDVGNRAELAILAERLKAAVETEKIPGLQDLTAHTSCGIALFPHDGETVQDVLREADTAMYRAKRARRRQLAA